MKEFISRWCRFFDFFFPSGYFLVAVTLVAAGIGFAWIVDKVFL